MAKAAEDGGLGSSQPLKAPKAGAELISWAENKRRVGRASVSDYQYRLNLAFVLSYQWVTWSNQKRAFEMPRVSLSDDPNAPVRLTSNKIAPIVERSVAKMTKNLPQPECRPVSDDDNDYSAAQVATRILESEMNRLDWEPWVQAFLFKVATLGMSYAFVYWDPEDGEQIGAHPESPEEDLFEGNVRIDMVPAYELAVSPSAATMRNAKWAVRTTTMLREDAWDKWGVELEGGAHRTIAQDVMALGNEMTQEQAIGEWVEVHQLWHLPSKAVPQGVVFTWSGQTVLEHKAFPYNHKRLPFVQCDLLPGLVGREGRTWVNDLIPLQIDYNDTISREATIRRQLVPKWIGPVGSIDPNRVTNRVEVMLYRQVGEKPTLEMPNSGWMQQFELGMERDSNDMGERAGVNDATAGHAATSAPAASILALQDADDTKLSISATSFASFISQLGWQILMLARQYWAEQRTVRVWSDDSVLEAYRYLGSDIDKQLDVHVGAESAMPRSKAARTQMIMELAKMFPQIIDPQDVIRMLELPGFDFVIRSQDIDTRKQHREIGMLLEGTDCAVEPFDNHMIHLKVLNDFRKGREYEQFDEETKARFDAHAAVHESLVLKQRGIQLPVPQPAMDPAALQQANNASAGPAGHAQAAPSGAPGEGGGGTPPNTPGVDQLAGIGQGAGQPGSIPGVPPDMQAQSMGS